MSEQEAIEALAVAVGHARGHPTYMREAQAYADVLRAHPAILLALLPDVSAAWTAYQQAQVALAEGKPSSYYRIKETGVRVLHAIEAVWRP
jgi:hypothetical protein